MAIVRPPCSPSRHRCKLKGQSKKRSPMMSLHNTPEIKRDTQKTAPEKSESRREPVNPANGKEPPRKNSEALHKTPLSSLDNIAIMLDVDGTLLDIAPRPQEVFVPKNLRETLQLLRRELDGAVAFISGRPLHDIDRIFAPLK